MRATLLNDDEEALKDLRMKEEKRQAKDERKKKAEERKRNAVKRRKTAGKKKTPTARRAEETDEEDDPDIQMRLDDSSEYSDEFQEEDDHLTTLHYPFAAKEPEVRDFLLFSKLVFSSCFLVLDSLVFLSFLIINML